MSATIEQRLETVEQELAALKARLLEEQPWLLSPVKKDWQATVGWANNSKLHEAATKAGEEYRRSQTYEREIEARGGAGYLPPVCIESRWTLCRTTDQAPECRP